MVNTLKFRKLLGNPINISEGLAWYKEPTRHFMVVGGSGSGKTVLFQHLLKDVDVGCIVISPDGELAERAYTKDCQYITKDNPISLNPLTVEYLNTNPSF